MQSTLQHLARQKHLGQPHKVKCLPVSQVLNALRPEFDAIAQLRRCNVAACLSQGSFLRLESDHMQRKEEGTQLGGNGADARPNIQESGLKIPQALYKANQD